DNNQDFIATFWACVLGGIVPVPAAVPSGFQQSNSAAGRLQAAWNLLGRPAVLAGEKPAAEIREWAARAGTGMRGVCIPSASASRHPLAEKDGLSSEDRHESAPHDVALILLTSGSTGLPKGVQLTHRNMIARSAATKQFNALSGNEVTLNWLPLDHV